MKKLLIHNLNEANMKSDKMFENIVKQLDSTLNQDPVVVTARY